MAEIPPWITPQQSLGLGNLYAEGIKLRHDQAQIAQRYQLAQQELDQRQAQNEREAMVQEQRLKIEKSYKDQMVSMQQQELEQKRRMDEIKTQEAAEKFAAQARFRDLIQQAGPNANVPQLLFQSGAAADMSGPGQAALYKAGQTTTQPAPPNGAQVPQGMVVRPTMKGWDVVNAPRPPVERQEAQIGMIKLGGQEFAAVRQPTGSITLTPAYAPPSLSETNIAGQPFALVNQKGTISPRQVHLPTQRAGTDLTARQKARIDLLKDELKDLQKLNRFGRPKKNKAFQEDYDKRQKRIDDIDVELNELTRTLAPTATNAPTSGKTGNYTWEVVGEGED